MNSSPRDFWTHRISGDAFGNDYPKFQACGHQQGLAGVQTELAGNPIVAQSREFQRLVTSQKAAESLKNTSLGLQIILLFIRSIHFELRPMSPKLSTLPVSSVYTRFAGCNSN
jgi:hypothetical protein